MRWKGKNEMLCLNEWLALVIMTLIQERETLAPVSHFLPLSSPLAFSIFLPPSDSLSSATKEKERGGKISASLSLPIRVIIFDISSFRSQPERGQFEEHRDFHSTVIVRLKIEGSDFDPPVSFPTVASLRQ